MLDTNKMQTSKVYTINYKENSYNQANLKIGTYQYKRAMSHSHTRQLPTDLHQDHLR